MTSLAAELHAAYLASGLTYLQIAVRSELSLSTITRALNHGDVHVLSLLRICEVLKRQIYIEKQAA